MGVGWCLVGRDIGVELLMESVGINREVGGVVGVSVVL